MFAPKLQNKPKVLKQGVNKSIENQTMCDAAAIEYDMHKGFK